ncbi:hypothetical protein FHS14_005174 [Paenibacillus baekrokdamisoli]|uniref:hypothetical protein n=1 Tax=Paenibacillus baekrokdamisoli TaxID=1712516 RepID=UPI001797796D|nr:hypothetical protein [Paenibacillus baekrokdamisoli]MBB3072159.1 hypothetical protein [Paenibacillus baekrokdamisoli]
MLEFDLSGKPASSITKTDEIAQLLMLNVIPEKEQMIVLFSWLKEHEETYKKFREELLSLSAGQQLQLLNNIIPTYCENVVFSPNFIDTWDKSKIEEYERKFHSTLRNPFPPEKRNLLAKSFANLFEDMEKDS